MSAQANRYSTDRRQFLLAASAMASAAMAPVHAAMGADQGSNAGQKAVLLRPSAKQNLFRVRVELEVEGNANLSKNSLVSRKSELQLPINSSATLDYEERLHRPTGAEATNVTVAERYYHEAKSEGTLNKSEQTCELRATARNTIVRRDVMPEVVYSLEDYFERSELDLLRLPASSLGLDDMLPIEAVSAGSKYQPSSDAMVSLLSLSSVEETDVVAEVVAITADDAKIQFTGKVAGSIDGVPTTVRTVGKLTFDRKIGACTWLAMAVHETREIGKAEPGFDVSATIKMLRKPLSAPIALSAKAPNLDTSEPIPQDRLYVELKSDELGLGVLMDRRWRMMTDVPGSAMMRMIENDRSIAQCDFRPLASLATGSQWTLAAFEQDVKKTLGEQMSELVSAEERASEAGLRVLRVTASGAAEGVPIQWVLMHFSDDSGRRLLASFTLEGKNASTFAGSDHQLGGSLRLIERRPGKGEAVTQKTGLPRPTRIGNAKFGATDKPGVQSASDLK